MRHSTKNGCTEQDEVFNPYTQQWECMHCGETLSVVTEHTENTSRVTRKVPTSVVTETKQSPDTSEAVKAKYISQSASSGDARRMRDNSASLVPEQKQEAEKK